MATERTTEKPALASKPRPEIGIEHGRQQVATAPAANGYIDFYGYAVPAGGWLFCGWSAERWMQGEESVTAVFERGRIVAGTMVLWHERADLGRRGTGVVVLLRSSASQALGDLVALEVRIGARHLRLPCLRPAVRLDEIDLLMRARQIAGEGANSGAAGLAHLLTRPVYTGRDTLAELPIPIRMHVDETILAPPDGLLVVGWRLDIDETVAAIRVRCGAMAPQALLERSVRIARPDVLEAVGNPLGITDPQCGFIAYVPGCLSASAATYIEVELKSGEIGYRPLPQPARTGVAAIRRVLDDVELAPDELAAAFDGVLGPPLTAINRARLAKPRPSSVADFGDLNLAPVCSMIVPLYGRVDFIVYQLALLSAHDGIAAHELIYVLDDPQRKRELLDLAHSAHRRFGLPFRIVALESNLGYGPANNVGLSHARGEYICFLNSDVMPDEPRWLDLMVEDLRADPSLGVVGARLLFEDGTVQHDGMVFERLPRHGGWPFPMHPGKGRLPRGEAALVDAEAVTGACMVLRADLARELGGFDEDYVIGDFEDSDLCLRVRRMGLRCAVDRRARLFHLERQSQALADREWRTSVTTLNAWTHTRRWFPDESAD